MMPEEKQKYLKAISNANLSPFTVMDFQLRVVVCDLWENLNAVGQVPDRNWLNSFFEENKVNI